MINSPTEKRAEVSASAQTLERASKAIPESAAPYESAPILRRNLADIGHAYESDSEQRAVFSEVAQHFLTETPIPEELSRLEDKELATELQKQFQDNLLRHFDESGLAEQIDQLRSADHEQKEALDEQALNLIAQASEGVHGWIDMLPSLRNQYKEAGLNCTMGSAMLHIALEKLGYNDVHTVLRDGHHIVVRELPNGEMKLYDPTSLSTVDGELVGYTRTFKPEQVANKNPVSEGRGLNGFSFTLRSNEQDKVGGFRGEPGADGVYHQNFYAYDPHIKMDMTIALGNLSEIQEDAAKVERGEQEPTFDMDAYRDAVVGFIQKNNQRELTMNELKDVARENKQMLEELIQAAEKSFRGEGEAPNPKDFLQSELLHFNDDANEAPNPRAFTGRSERYVQAQELCKEFPVLKQINYKAMIKKFDLFDGYEYLK